LKAAALVQARRNAWELGGIAGNLRGPVNREIYRLVEIRAGDVVGDRVDGTGRITLPSTYVEEHLTLGYASTVHSAQGRTVDTAHAAVSPRTGAAAAYVALTRGRLANTAYVATVDIPEDSPPGQASTVDHRQPVEVLADVLEREQDDQSALQLEAESRTHRDSARTVGDRLADAAEITAAMLLSNTLDRLAAIGMLTEVERRRLAADRAAGQLSRLLRRAELAGHDVDVALSDAIARQPLAGAESIAAVLHSRLERQLDGRLVPRGDTFAARMPNVTDPVWRRYLAQVAETADQRARELGSEVAAAPPQWARENLGAVPADPVERLAWEQRAGQVAAYREMSGHEDEATALGPAPRPGKVEHHAAWHAAWRALGRPESDREESELADGQLLARLRAYEREENWAPAYVADRGQQPDRDAGAAGDAARPARSGAAAGRDDRHGRELSARRRA
jgi:hypothetical protein